MSIKIVIGVVLIAISFVYLIKNPGQSMMAGLMKKQRVDQEKLAAEYAAKKAAEASETSEGAKTEEASKTAASSEVSEASETAKE